MNRVVYNKFYGGISSDGSLGGAGSVYNIEGVDIHQDTKYVQLAKNGGSFNLLNTRTNGWVTSALYESNIYFLEATYDGYISGILYNSLNLGDLMTGYYSYIYNLGKITNSSGNTYGFGFTDQEFFYWIYDKNEFSLGLLGSDTITDNSFENPASWTVGSNWTIDGDATHTSGSTDVLSQTLTLTASQVYRFVIKTNTITSGTCTIKIAGNTILTVTATDDNKPLVEYYTASGTSELLEFIPSSDFVGSFAFTYLEEFAASDTAQTFNKYCPYNIYSDYIYVGNGNKITRVNMQTGTPIIVDVLTIDKEYTIRGITRISDQFFVYATNGTNSRQYVWDGASEAASRIITWVDKPIQNVANFANIDYVIAGTSNRQGIYRVNGIQLDPIILGEDWETSVDRKYFDADKTNAVETFSNRLLLSGRYGIFSLGSSVPGIGQGLVKEFTYPASTLTCMFFAEGIGYNLYYYVYGTIDGTLGNYRVSNYLSGSSPEYGTFRYGKTGWIELHPYYGQTYSNLKQLRKFTLGYELEDKTSINVYIRDTLYANVYYNSTSTDFSIGDTYTNNGITYTVLDITRYDGTNGCILHCSISGSGLNGYVSGTFTKTAGDGPASFYSNKVRYGYRLLEKITDTTKNRITQTMTGTYNKFQLALELVTGDGDVTPKLYDFNLYFDEGSND